MAWEDRRWSSAGGGGGGRFRDALRRVFGDGENPLSWAIPLYRAWGITVKIHIIFVVVIIARLLWAIPQGNWGFWFMAMMMGTLFVLVLLHEYGHCVACRRVGGEAHQIVMWPLGGLAFVAPPHNWRADLVTTLGGPAVNAILLPLLAGALLAITRNWGSVLFNPFDPTWGLLEATLPSGGQPMWLAGLWMAYYSNFILLAFNMLVPMYPLDAGRVVQAILWSRLGHRESMRIATTVGFVAAVVLAIFGWVAESTTLLAIAIFGGITCWIEKQRLKAAGEYGVPGGYDFSAGYSSLPADEEEAAAPSRAELRRRKRMEEEQAELDRILAKIARTGMASLTRREERFLRSATERGRRG